MVNHIGGVMTENRSRAGKAENSPAQKSSPWRKRQRSPAEMNHDVGIVQNLVHFHQAAVPRVAEVDHRIEVGGIVPLDAVAAGMAPLLDDVRRQNAKGFRERR